MVQTSPAESEEGPIRSMREELTRRLAEVLMRRGEASPLDAEALASPLLADCVRERASDLHLDPEHDGLRVRLRVDGALVDAALLTHEEGQRLTNYLKTEAGVDPVRQFTPREARWSTDIGGEPLDIRMTAIPALHGVKLTLRLLYPQRIGHRLGDLGMARDEAAHIEAWLRSLSGMFAVAGPTATGKTTTLYALLHELRTHHRGIVTIEDPIEYGIDGICQVQVDERHDLTFQTGLKTMLRLDPDYMMLGEMRDDDSAQVALTAAIGGRIMLSTLHSRDAVSVVTSLRNWAIPNAEIAAGLAVVVSQRLIRKLCPHCRRETAVDPVDRRWLQRLKVPVPERAWEAPGCRQCHGLGFRGRTGIFEVWRLRASRVMIGLSGRGEQVSGKAPDAGDASIAEAGQRSMTPAQAGRTGQESREML